MTFDPTIELPSGRRVKQFIMPPRPVKDRTIRCVFCGQIDEQPFHDETLCIDRLRARGDALAIADHVAGGRPERCWGHKAKRWEAAFEAAFLAITCTLTIGG